MVDGLVLQCFSRVGFRQVNTFFAEIHIAVDGSFFSIEVEKEDVAIGGYAHLKTCLGAAGIFNLS